MSGHTSLDAWLGEQLLGRLERRRGSLRFVYERSAIERHGLGIPLVSVSLPTTLRPLSQRFCLPFFDGLLPEGEARRIIAYDLGLPEADTFGLLAVLGRECAGALAIVATGGSPPPTPTVEAARPMTDDELARKVLNLRGFPLGVDHDIRVSLGGVQEKLLITRKRNGWGLPVEGSASTHIVKPGRSDLPGNVVSEALCLRVAAALAVPVASAVLDKIAGFDVIIVERFDRAVADDGTIERFHQENACQALGVPVGSVPRKYEQSGGPSLRQVASVLTRWGTTDDLEMLLRHTTVNVLVGNADGHAMNTSFLLAPRGVLTLSPMYDVFSSLHYQVDATPGMYINGQTDLRNVTMRDLIAEGIGWGIPPPRAQNIVDELLTNGPAAVTEALNATPQAAGPIGDFLVQRIASLSRSAR